MRAAEGGAPGLDLGFAGLKAYSGFGGTGSRARVGASRAVRCPGGSLPFGSVCQLPPQGEAVQPCHSPCPWMCLCRVPLDTINRL